MSPEAVERMLAFEAWVEPQLSEFGALGSLTDFGGKLVGGVARIAGLLHMGEHAGREAPWDSLISLGTVERAIRIGEYLIPHARAAYATMGADAAIEDAKRVLAWVHRQGLSNFSKRQLFQDMKGYFKRVSQLEPALAVLEEHGYIRCRLAEPRPGAGRKPSPVYEVNPLSLAQNTRDVGPEPNCGDFEDYGKDNQKHILESSISVSSHDTPMGDGSPHDSLTASVAPQNSHNPQNCAAEPGAESLFGPDELELLKDCPPEDLAGLANIKNIFPGSRVIEAGLKKKG